MASGPEWRATGEHWRRSEPVCPRAERALGRKRDRQQLFFGTGRRGQLEADRHAGAVAPDRHRDRAQAEVIDPSRITNDAAVDPEMTVGVAR